jgi:hypothetical protein
MFGSLSLVTYNLGFRKGKFSQWIQNPWNPKYHTQCLCVFFSSKNTPHKWPSNSRVFTLEKIVKTCQKTSMNSHEQFLPVIIKKHLLFLLLLFNSVISWESIFNLMFSPSKEMTGLGLWPSKPNSLNTIFTR